MSLSTCLFSSRRHGPLPQGSCELAASSSWPATCSSAGAAAGANEQFKCRHDRRGPRASRSHAHRAEGVRPNRLTFTADGGLARRSRYPLLVRSHLTRQLAGRIDGLVSRVVAEGSRPRPPAAHRQGGLLVDRIWPSAAISFRRTGLHEFEGAEPPLRLCGVRARRGPITRNIGLSMSFTAEVRQSASARRNFCRKPGPRHNVN